MLITNRRPKLKTENRFQPKLYQALFNNSIAMATDWFVFEMKAY